METKDSKIHDLEAAFNRAAQEHATRTDELSSEVSECKRAIEELTAGRTALIAEHSVTVDEVSIYFHLFCLSF